MTKLLVNPGATTGHAIAIIAACVNVANTPGYAGPDALVLTFVETGEHMATSRHYFGDAVDMRSKTFPDGSTKRTFIEAVLARLNDHRYVGILEAAGTDNEHFHFQWKG